MAVSTFGRGSTQSRQAAWWRLGGLAGAALGIGLLAAHGASLLTLNTLPEPERLLAPTLWIAMSTTYISLLAAIGALTAADRTTELLLYLPLRSGTRWLIAMLPQLIIVGLACLVCLPALWQLCSQLGMEAWLFGVAATVGIGSMLGLLYGTSRQSWVAYGSGFGVVAGGYGLTRVVLDGTATGSDLTVAWGAIIVIVCIGWIRLPVAARLLQARTAPAVHIILRPALNCRWHLSQLLRHTTVRLGLGATFGISSAGAGLLLYFGVSNSSLCLVGACMLAASCIADMRGVSRRHLPPEATALRATARFWWPLAGAGCLLTSIAISPLLVLASQNSSVAIVAATYGAALGIGLLAGALVVPAGRDISAQALASLGAAGSIAGLPQLPGMSAVDQNPSGWIVIASLTLLAAWNIEYYRNYYQWRKIHAKQPTPPLVRTRH